MTGLDIDAAKNGSHPDLSSFVDSVKSIPNAPYLKFKKDFDKLRKNSKYIFDKLKIEDDEREKKFVISVSGIDKNVEYSSENRNYGTGINRLPIIFQDELVKYKEKKHKRRETCNPFNELQDKDDDLLIKEYTDKCNAVFDRYNWYRGFVKELAGQSDAQDKLDKAIPNETNIEEIMERINKFKWQFQPYNNRADVLEKIIGNDFNAECLSDEEKELLYHFGHYGFKRLWYILSVIKESRFLPYVKMREEYVEKQRNKKKADNEEIAELRDYELEKLTRKYYEENLTNIQSRIYNICLTQLSDIIKNSEISDESKINHLYKMTEGNEKKRRFFWDVFSWEELEKCLDTKGV